MVDETEFPFFRPDGLGMSVLLTSPGLLFAIRADWRRPLPWLLLGAAVLVLIPTLLYYGGGWLQYGYRYFLDSIPFIWAICGLAAVLPGRRELAVAGRHPRRPRRHGLRAALRIPDLMRTAWSLRDERGRPTPLLIGLAAIGGVFLLVVAVNRWGTPSDEHAYWLAAQRLIDGEPIYDPTATSVTPYAYWYPPFVAQVLAPSQPSSPRWHSRLHGPP